MLPALLQSVPDPELPIPTLVVSTPPMTNIRSISFSLTVFVAACLGACGGGGSDSVSGSTLAMKDGVAIQQLALPTAAIAAPATATQRVGIGMTGLSYYDRSFAMTDVGRQAQVRGLDWSYNVLKDADGSPRQDFQLPYSSTKIAAGTYKLSFNGRATVSAGGAGTVQNAHFDPLQNLSTLDVVLPTDGIGNVWLVFRNTFRNSDSAKGDGISNIHLMRPGYSVGDSRLFTTEFIAAMQRFKLIRGMDFTSVNTNPQRSWSERTKPDFFGATGANGQSWELLVAMANASNRDIWLNVPARADDDYIQKLAQLVKFGSDGNLPYASAQAKPIYAPLKVGLKVYVEYGNELWNSAPGFMGFRWALEFANVYKADTTHPIAFDGAQTDQYLALRRWIAYRSAHTSLAFRDVFGDAAMMSSVRPILAGQAGNGNLFLSIGLQWAQAFYGQVRSAAPMNAVARKPSDIWYGGGGAAYYEGGIDPKDTSATTLDTYFASLPTPTFARLAIADSIWTHAYGLKYVAYEGGPGPGGSALGSIASSAISSAFNNDLRMKDRMLIAQDIWDQAGGDELVYYVYSGSAPWSFSNELVQQVVSDNTSVKLQAVDAINAKTRPPVTLGTLVPGAVHLKDPASQTLAKDGASWALNNTAYLLRPATLGTYLLVPIQTTMAGTYQISLKLGTQMAGTVAVHVNGASVGDIALSPDPVNTTAKSSKVSVALPAGLSVVRVDLPTGTQDIFVVDLVVQ